VLGKLTENISIDPRSGLGRIYGQFNVLCVCEGYKKQHDHDSI
jgi:hypothetical protein